MSEYGTGTRPLSIAVIINADHYLSLLSGGYSVAQARKGWLFVFVITSLDKRPVWFTLPGKYEETRIDILPITGLSPVNEILKDLSDL